MNDVPDYSEINLQFFRELKHIDFAGMDALTYLNDLLLSEYSIAMPFATRYAIWTCSRPAAISFSVSPLRMSVPTVISLSA